MRGQGGAIDQGRISFRLRIGVTGHRDIQDARTLTGQVAEAVRRIEARASSAHTPVVFTVVSALAEGSDRLVAREVLKHPAADLEAVLPLPREDYGLDFGSDASSREFGALLADAREVTELPPRATRTEAYEQAGRYVVDRSDVLIAVWDGEAPRGQGGTAEVVAYARECAKPVMWIDAQGRRGVVEEAGNAIGGRALREFDTYNRAGIPRDRFEREVRRQSQKRRQSAERSGAQALPVDALSAWLWPFYVRADLLAERYQRWYYALGSALFLMAAAAVAAAAAQVLFTPEAPPLVWLEVGLMVGLLVVVGAGRRLQLHDRWISYRFLAERFRSAFFLAAAGLSGRREGGLERVSLASEPEEWLRRAFAEVWSRRPEIMLGESDVEGLRRVLANAWIHDQEAYHRGTSRKNKARHHLITGALGSLFALTLVAALLHGVGFAGHVEVGVLSPATLLSFLAVALPALGGALGGIRAQREFLRHGERFGRMAHHLRDIEGRMQAAANLEAVRTVATQAEELMLEESRDWFVVVRFHDFELHV